MLSTEENQYKSKYTLTMGGVVSTITEADAPVELSPTLFTAITVT